MKLFYFERIKQKDLAVMFEYSQPTISKIINQCTKKMMLELVDEELIEKPRERKRK